MGLDLKLLCFVFAYGRSKPGRRNQLIPGGPDRRLGFFNQAKSSLRVAARPDCFEGGVT